MSSPVSFVLPSLRPNQQPTICLLLRLLLRLPPPTNYQARGRLDPSSFWCLPLLLHSPHRWARNESRKAVKNPHPTRKFTLHSSPECFRWHRILTNSLAVRSQSYTLWKRSSTSRANFTLLVGTRLGQYAVLRPRMYVHSYHRLSSWGYRVGLASRHNARAW